MGRHHFGQIVYARVVNRQGQVKERTLLIIDSDAACDAGDDLLVVAISSKIRTPLIPYHHIVHNSHLMDPTTGLDRPCVAKCNFVDTIAQSSIRRAVGDMPDPLLRTIVETFDLLFTDPNFQDWQ